MRRPPHSEAVEAAAEMTDDELGIAEMEAQDSGFLTHMQMPKPATADVPEVLRTRRLQNAWGAENLRTGSWVDLALGGERWVRGQLSWASPHRTLFMFTRRAGGMAHSMSRRTMDRLRGLGLIRLVSDGHVMDNALDAVAG